MSILIAGILPSINNCTWKLIDYGPLKQEDIIIRHYKRGKPHESPEGRFYVVDADISKKITSKYENVKHLKDIGATGSGLVGTIITMVLLQDEG